MSKIIVLIFLWLTVCNAGLYSGYIDDSSVYQADGAQECVTVVVYDTTAKFRAISSTNDTKLQIIYGTSESSLTSRTDIDTATVVGDVLTVSATGLTAGQKYYYKATYGTSESGGIITSPVTVTPTDTITRYFRIPYATTATTYSYKFVIISDAHFNCNSLVNCWNPALIKSNLQSISAGIKSVSPDFVVFAGDDIQLEDASGSVADENDPTDANERLGYNYASFHLALADLGIPAYFAIGNHEMSYGNWASQCDSDAGASRYNPQCPCATSDDASACATKYGRLDTYEAGATGFLYYRNKYLMTPSTTGAVAGSYSYLDYGGSRLFFLDPYRNKTETSIITNDCPYALGAAQASWYKNANRFQKGKWIFTFTHQALKQKLTPISSTTGANQNTEYTYGWGGVDDGSNTWANQGCNEWQLYKPLKSSVAQRFLFLGHSHYYAREQWQNMYVYSLPAPFRTTEDSATISAANYVNSTYYGYREEEPHAEPGKGSTGGVPMLLVEVSESKVIVYGLKADGTYHANVPIDTYYRKAVLN